ncbi:hypothetical protein Tco_1352726 [Tanacetum coccineum]
MNTQSMTTALYNRKKKRVLDKGESVVQINVWVPSWKVIIPGLEKRTKKLRNQISSGSYSSADVHDTLPILLSFTHCGNKTILRVLRIILVILPEHPSETKVFHNEDGNPARANIKQALGSYERSHKGVKASANSDIVYFFTSAQDGDPLQDDVRLCLGDDLKKAQDHNQRQVKDESKDHYPKTNRNTPRAPRTPTVSASPQETKKRKQAAGESSSPRKSLKITIKQKQLVKKDDDDFEDRIEPGSHKDNPEVVVDDDDNEREKKDDELGSLEVRNEETQTTIPTPLSSPRKILSSDKKTFQELTDIVSNPTTSTSKHSQVKKRISSKYSHLPGALHGMYRRQDSSANFSIQLYLKMKRNLQDRADDIALWEALRRKFEKSSTSNTSCREDDFHSHHDEHQDDDAPPEGEKRIKRSKTSKRSKSARDSSSKHSRKDSTTYNVDKRVPTIFDHARMKATLRDSLSNLSRNAAEYAYHLEQSTNFMKN